MPVKLVNLAEYKAKKEAKRQELEQLMYQAIAKMNEQSTADMEAIDRLLWDLGYKPEDLLD